jgi:acetyltransferase-like isoleucine patch superfamily enzyme
MLQNEKVSIKGKSIFILANVSNTGKNICQFENCKIIKTRVRTEGNGNLFENKGSIRYSDILIAGENNQLIIGNNVSIVRLKLVVRGNNCKVIIGEHTTFGGGYLVCMGISNEIIIGKDCQIADDVSIWASDSHPIYDIDGEVSNLSKPIYIDNHVWIGNKSIVLKGITIGKDSVIGMGSVTTKNVDSNSLYVGNPAKKIRDIKTWDRSFITV